MLGNVDLTKDTLGTARDILFDVYRVNDQHQRERIRRLKRIVNLAKERGFENEQALLSSLQVDPRRMVGMAERPIKQLFEFVSPDEVVLLSQPLLEN